MSIIPNHLKATEPYGLHKGVPLRLHLVRDLEAIKLTKSPQITAYNARDALQQYLDYKYCNLNFIRSGDWSVRFFVFTEGKKAIRFKIID